MPSERHWFKVSGRFLSYEDEEIGKFATGVDPFGSERIRYEGTGPLTALLAENNAGYLIVDERSVEHEFLTSDGRGHIPVRRWTVNNWPTG